MSTLRNPVYSFGDLNTRIQVSLMITNVSNQPIDQNINKQVLDFIRADELEPAIYDFFVTRNETALQVKYAKSIIEELLNLWLPTCRSISNRLSMLQEQKNSLQNVNDSLRDYNLDIRDLVTDLETGAPILIAKYMDENIMILNNWFQLLEDLNRRIIHHIRQFAPELYTKYRDTFYQYISLKEHTFIMVNDESPQKEPVIKLHWNGAADTLYDVFRQLKNHHLPNGSALLEDSYDNIAFFIQQTFVGFDKIETSTIRGQLTKNKRPKKSFNRVDLDFTEPD